MALTYDMTNRDSFDNLPDWLEAVQRYGRSCDKMPVLAVFANKGVSLS